MLEFIHAQKGYALIGPLITSLLTPLLVAGLLSARQGPCG